MSEFSAFASLMNDFIEFFDTLIPIEQEKLDAAVHNRVSQVEDSMHKEQAAIMRLKGLELKREAEQKRLGLEGCTFQQILNKVSSDDAAILRPLFNAMNDKVRIVQSLSGNIKDAIEVNLYTIEAALAKKDQAGSSTYSASGKKNENPASKHFSSRSI